MRQVTDDDITAEVLRRFQNTPDPRLKQLMSALVRHLHAFVREVELTEDEWFTAIRYLGDAGRISVNGREEFILMSDIFGVSMLVDLINHRKPQGATESTVIGPFYVEESPEMPYGGNIAWHDAGIPTFVYGRVLDINRQPIPGARLDVWQTASDGLYDIQNAGLEEPHMRGRFHANNEGRYLVRTVRPVSHPIPHDGPVGAILHATNRQHYRPAHVHFMVSADGCETLTTHLFDSSDPLLDADPVFGVKESLICDFVRHDTAPDSRGDGRSDGTDPKRGDDSIPRLNVEPPYYTLEYDFVMKPGVRSEPARALRIT